MVVFLAFFGYSIKSVILFSFFIYISLKNIKNAGFLSLLVEMFITISISYNMFFYLSFECRDDKIYRSIVDLIKNNSQYFQKHIYNYTLPEYYKYIVIFIILFYTYRLYLEKTKKI